ncbi:hypothetical protein BB560_004656, partial [Smittium megazygosporum]
MTAQQRDLLSVLDSLKTEARNPNSMKIDSLSTTEMLKVINEEDKTVALVVERILPEIARAVDGIAERMSRGGRLLYFGAGTSGRLGILDASECPPTYSTDPNLVVGVMAGGDKAIRQAQENVEDQIETGREDCMNENVRDVDVVVGIAASGRTPYVIGAIEYGNEVGALTIGVSTNAVSTMNECVQILLAAEVGPEVVTGSTRMKSGTAQKLILNMLTTGAMIKLGKTYGNLMVDFRPTNEKLRLRAPKIVSEVTGVSREEAIEVLGRCDGQVKVAIMCILAKKDPVAAEKLLHENGNILYRAIKACSNDTLNGDESNSSESTPVYLVADGGGTKTLIYLIGRDGQEVGQATVGSSNFSSVGLDTIRDRILEGLKTASAGKGNIKVVKALIGLAGIGDEKVANALKKELSGMCDDLTITTDIKLIQSVLPKSTDDTLSISVIAGTGSSVLTEHKDGSLEICGGWGPILGDQGSGFMIGSATLKAVSAAIEGAGPYTTLVETIREKWQVQNRLDFVRFIQAKAPGVQRSEIAKLAADVLEHAYVKNDKIAKEIIESQVTTLANFIVSLAKRNNISKINLACTGSLVVKGEPYRADLLRKIDEQGVEVLLVKLVDIPAISAAKHL